jgi:hypothetical protein
MDLDELIASLQAAAGAPASDALLISIDAFVPPKSDDPAADRDAARRMVAAFAYWLVKYDHVAPDVAPERAATLANVVSRPEQAVEIMEESGDLLLGSDVQTEWRELAWAYLNPVGDGWLGEDYFRLFVEATGGRSMRDAVPTRSDYDQLAKLIESRAERFLRNDPDWREPVDVPGAPEPALWEGDSKEEWLRRLGTYEDLLDTLPKQFRARLAEYWSLVDAAPSMPDPEVATALVRTYLWVRDSSIQEAVHRALEGFPPEVAIRGILPNIVEIESRTDWAETVVNVFPDDLGKRELKRLAEIIDASPLDQQGAYSRALTSAARNGSRHAAGLLKVRSASG